MFCLLPLLAYVSAQNTGGPSGPIGPPLVPPMPVNQTILMSSLDLPIQGNYSIGYLPPTMLGLTNSSACRRISMFKFPALGSGSIQTMSLNVIPETVRETCDIGVTLFNFPAQVQIGTQYIGAFTNTLASTPEESITVDVSSSRWNIVNGSQYYLTIQTFTWNSAGGRCNMRIPWGLTSTGSVAGTIISPKYAVVVQQGPPDLPCGTTPWATSAALDGGYIHMRMTGFLDVSPSSTGTPTPTGTPTSTVSYYLKDSSLSGTSATTVSSTGTPTSTGTGTASPSSTGTPTNSVSPALSDFTYSSTVTVTVTPFYTSALMTSTQSSSPTTNYLRTDSQGQSNEKQSVLTAIAQGGPVAIGSIIGSLLFAALLGATIVILFKKNQEFGITRSPMSSVVVNNPTNIHGSVEHINGLRI